MRTLAQIYKDKLANAKDGEVVNTSALQIESISRFAKAVGYRIRGVSMVSGFELTDRSEVSPQLHYISLETMIKWHNSPHKGVRCASYITDLIVHGRKFKLVQQVKMQRGNCLGMKTVTIQDHYVRIL